MSEEKPFTRTKHNDHLEQETRSLPQAPRLKRQPHMRVVEEGRVEDPDPPRSYRDQLKRL